MPCLIYLVGLFFVATSVGGFFVNVQHRPIVQGRTLSMNMVERFFKVVSSNVNNAIKKLEDPEKILDQAVDDMQNDLVKIRQSYAEISATQKRMENQRVQAESVANEWYRRAQLALQKGDEELAREALSRRQTQNDIVDGLVKQIDIQTSAIDKLYTSMVALEKKIMDAKRERDGLIARAKTAKAAVQVNEMLATTGLGSGSNSMEAFERMKAKVESLETQVEIAGELAATTSGSSLNMEEKFRALEGNSKIDDELEMLRKQLPGTSKPISQLPPPKADAILDLEYEKIKKELGL